MHSLSNTPGLGAAADSGLASRLKRLCVLLGIAGGKIAAFSGGKTNVLATTGIAPRNLDQLDARTRTAGESQIIADTGVADAAMARFYVGVLVPGDGPRECFLLSLFDHRPRSAEMAEHLATLANDAATQAIMARQRRKISEQARTIEDYAAVEEYRRSLFDRASATARIGIWQCNLSDNSITWTNGVYDLFEIPRNTPVTRETTLALYSEDSRREVEAVRSHAIATCSDFSIDCEVVTLTGKRRWMRLTGAVESRNGVAYRIFGMKQDITEEKLMVDRTRYLAEFDTMTGLANRSLFQTHLTALDDGQQHISALLLVDLDGFKQLNDTYGHALGDECLKEAARRLTESAGAVELVARIGGDEFAVLLGAHVTADEASDLARHIVAMIGKPLLRGGHHLRLAASVGIAQYSGGSSEDLFRQADIALYAAKAAGRNTSRSYITDAA